MSKHTSGPWKVIEREILEDGSVYPRHILGHRLDFEVCSMEGAASAHAFVNNPDWKELGKSEMCLANARLIAAAPELLDASKDAVARITSCLLLLKCDDEFIANETKNLRDAIAKATGEQQ